jgi:5-methyltetrahydropteroyltriglutamate--homocysteine methyltransferase
VRSRGETANHYRLQIALRNTKKFLTTHTGSLPRPEGLRELLIEREEGRSVDDGAFRKAAAAGVGEVVKRQLTTGIDLINDGELSKFSYSMYAKERLTGLDGKGGERALSRDVAEFPTFAAKTPMRRWQVTTCTGPVAVKDTRSLEDDLRNFAEAVRDVKPAGTFLTAASPGVIASFIHNRYYPSHEAYVRALAAAMQPEYEAIVGAGFDLQIDCPDLASARNNTYRDDSEEEWRSKQALAVDVLNEITANIPPERMRMHLCWGNFEGPHHRDIPLEDVLPVALRARPHAISFEGANPRHEHEWIVFKDIKLPDDKVIIPGMIDSTTNFIEHPELVAQRIERYANVVGRERVIAGVDCGFATSANSNTVDGEIAWAKLRALVEGAAIASERLWR